MIGNQAQSSWREKPRATARAPSVNPVCALKPSAETARWHSPRQTRSRNWIIASSIGMCRAPCRTKSRPLAALSATCRFRVAGAFGHAGRGWRRSLRCRRRAPSRWPVADLVALIARPLWVPNTVLIAASSPLSPAGVGWRERSSAGHGMLARRLGAGLVAWLGGRRL